MKIAILSDIHGNSWALEAVLDDLVKRDANLIVNLGDSLYGPLQPNETYKLIRSGDFISISGNEDRLILEGEQSSPTLDYVINDLCPEAFQWLQSLPLTQVVLSDIFICHGIPDFDNVYLTEEAIDGFVTVRGTDDIELLLKGVNQQIVLCGHSHLPRVININNRTIINPGSVGCPAFDDDHPVFHKIENFSHHARYCLVDLSDSKILVDHIFVPYNYRKAADCALKNNRPDWAKWIEHGRA